MALPQPAMLDYQPTESKVIQAPTAPRFLYRWHPERCEVIEVEGKAHIVPILSPLYLVSGINGVHSVGATDGNGQQWTDERVVADAIRQSASRGFKHIGPDVQVEAKFLPAGVQPGSYLRKTDVLASGRRGVRHHDCFEVAIERAGQPARIVDHPEKRNAWRASMAEAGAFGTVPAHVVEELRAPLVSERNRKRASPMATDLREERVAEVTARIEALDAAAAPKSTKGKAAPKAEAVAGA